jgi:hypothetical protein
MNRGYFVYDEQWDMCVEAEPREPMWKQVLDTVLCGVFAGVLVMMRLLAQP